MSVMNKALSQLTDKQESSLEQIKKAHVAPIKTRPAWVWMIGGFGLSLAVGGWAVSKQAPEVQVVNQPVQVQTYVEPQPAVASPTQKVNGADVAVYRSSKVEPVVTEVNEAKDEPVVAAKPAPKVASKVAVSQPKTTRAPISKPISKTKVAQPTLVASNAGAVKPVSSIESSPKENSVVIEHVELSAEQLSKKAISRAKKAMEANEFQEAVDAYTEALRYTPDNEYVRQKLAALYYGKGEVRKAFDLLQRGIELNQDGETLRIALAKFLIKEEQNEAALTPMVYLPPQVSIEYLSLRAALAQKSKQNEIALESYQKLTEQDANNGRWWLGLAIQQERASLLDEAKTSYEKALTKVGVSLQSQAFIRNRLDVLNHLEENNSAD